MKNLNDKLMKKLTEALKAVTPVIGIVLLLSFTIAPITPSILLCFLLGAVMVMLGMMFFMIYFLLLVFILNIMIKQLGMLRKLSK